MHYGNVERIEYGERLNYSGYCRTIHNLVFSYTCKSVDRRYIFYEALHVGRETNNPMLCLYELILRQYECLHESSILVYTLTSLSAKRFYNSMCRLLHCIVVTCQITG